MNASSEPQDAPAGQVAQSQLAPQHRLDKILAVVPRALSSHAHIIFLGALGIYLVALPLLGVNVSAKAELIGGNYTNVTSDLGACIAAGLTVHLVMRDKRRAQELHEHFERLRTRHERFEQSLARAIAAAERAEAAANARPPAP